jgi:peptidylprolyl isomerase
MARIWMAIAVCLCLSACGSQDSSTSSGVRTEPPPDVAAPPADAVSSRTGVASKVLAPGTGTVHPTASSRVTVHYSGWTTNGQLFDSSVTRGEPVTFPLSKVIRGWTEGLQLMVVGETRRFWIPEDMAYQGQQPPFGMLVFDVQLLQIQ